MLAHSKVPASTVPPSDHSQTSHMPSCRNQDTASGSPMDRPNITINAPSRRRTGNRSRMAASVRSEEGGAHAEQFLHVLHQALVGPEEDHVVIALDHRVAARDD